MPSNSNPAFVSGTKPTSDQWNGYFGAKVDAANGYLAGASLAGGAVSGTFTGSPTWSGNHTFSGTVTFGGTAAFPGAQSFTGGGVVGGTWSGTPSWSGLHTFGAGITVTGSAGLAANNTLFGRGQNFTLSGSTLDTTKFGLFVTNNIKGASSYIAGDIPGLASFTGQTDVAVPGGAVDGAEITFLVGGASPPTSAAGQYNGLSINLNDGANPTNDLAGGGNNAFVALQLARRSAVANGGTGLTPTTAFGGHWGIDIVNTITSGSVNNYLQHGLEINQSVSAATSFTASFATNVMTVTGTVTGGTLIVGQTVIASGVPAGTTIASLGTGTGGAGTYNLSTSPGTIASGACVAGGSAVRRAGIQLSQPPAHMVRGAMWDYGILVLNPGTHGLAPYRSGFCFGGILSTTSPLGTDASAFSLKLAADGTADCDTGLSLADGNFTTAAIKLPGGTKFDPSGNLQLGTTFLTASASGLAVDAKGSIGTIATGSGAVNNGGSGFTTTLNVFADDAYGGVYALGVTGTAVTSVARVIVQPTYPTTSPPSTIALTPRFPSQGTGCVLNGSWNITGTTLALQPSGGATKIGGEVGFNGTAPIAKPTVTGSKGSNAALTSLLTALASYGLLTDSST